MNAPRKLQQGLGLVEVMVSLVLGLLLLGGVMSAMLASKGSYRTSIALARIQENGRFGLDFFSRDLRMAGYSAVRERCSGAMIFSAENPLDSEGDLLNGKLRVALNDPTQDDVDAALSQLGGVEAALLGYAATSNGFNPALPSELSSLQPASQTDVISIFSSGTLTSNDSPVTISSHPSGANSANFGLTAPNGVPIPAEGDILIAMDRLCDAAAIVQVCQINSQKKGSVSEHTLVFNTGNGGGCNSRGNRTHKLGRDFTGGMLYGASSSSTRITYYVRTDPTTQRPALYRDANGNAQSLVEGIEDIHLLYGVDTDNDGNVNNYQTAANVADWKTVKAVRISLLVASPEANVTTEPQTLSFAGSVVDTSDRRLRGIFTTTVALRNKLP